MQFTDSSTCEITFTAIVFCFMMAGMITSEIRGGLPCINPFFPLVFLLSKYVVCEENEDGTETIGTKKFGYDLFEGPWGRVAFFSAMAVVLTVLCGIFIYKGFFDPKSASQGTDGSSGDSTTTKTPDSNKIAVVVIVAVFFILAILMSADSYGLYKRPLTPNQVTCLFFAYVGVVVVLIIMICGILVVAEISDIKKILLYAIPAGVIVILVIYALCNGLLDFNELSVYLRATPEDPDAGKVLPPPNA